MHRYSHIQFHSISLCRLLSVFVLAAFAVAAVAGQVLLSKDHASTQRTKLTASQFEEATSQSNKPVRFPTRNRKTEEFFEDGKLVKTILTEFEGTPADASRVTITENERGEVTKFEQIEFGNFIYTRSATGEWSKEPWYFQHGETEAVEEYLDSFVYWKEINIEDSSEGTLFRKSRIIKPFYGMKNYRDDDFYFSKEGKLLKRITTDRTLETPSIIIRRVTFSAAYDPTIKIVAPIK